MGLDQYIYRISKPELDERVFTAKELYDMNLSRASVENFEKNPNIYKQLIPYVAKRDVKYDVIDIEKIIEDYHLPSNSDIHFMSSEGITMCGTDESGNTIRQEISDSIIQSKYMVTKVKPYCIWKETEEAYWRKNWDLVEWLKRTMKKPIENTGYYRLNKTLIHRINSKFGSHVTEESATEDSAMFYWHWY